MYIFSVNSNFNSQYGKGSKQAGFIYKYPKATSLSFFDCRDPFTQETIDYITSEPGIIIKEGSFSEVKIITGSILTIANLSSF